MHKSELARIMHADANRWHNPYKREALYDRKGQAYEVLYYLTRDPEGKPVKDRHLTPVIVKDDVMVAIGAYRLKKLKRGKVSICRAVRRSAVPDFQSSTTTVHGMLKTSYKLRD